MAETTKLSVEKALEKLRGKEPSKSKNEQHDEKMNALDEEIKRMKSAEIAPLSTPAKAMISSHDGLTDAYLRTPRAAAVAGIIFSLLLFVCVSDCMRLLDIIRSA